ncbi:hypothetical protein OH76DRAFT_1348115, partial [Lentinus brumalis]
MLIWIRNALSPQEMRDALLADNQFTLRLISWLESCHQGDYATGSEAQVRARLLPINSAHSMNSEGENFDMDDDLFLRDPTTCLPRCPLPDPTTRNQIDWIRSMEQDADHVVFLSNRHDSDHRKGCKKGKDKPCRARFPRPLQGSTEVDDTGALTFRKTEPWINTFNPLLSFLLRCNSDVTCLLSGTQVHAIVAYVTDYITKPTLNTRTIMQTVREV